MAAMLLNRWPWLIATALHRRKWSKLTCESRIYSELKRQVYNVVALLTNNHFNLCQRIHGLIETSIYLHHLFERYLDYSPGTRLGSGWQMNGNFDQIFDFSGASKCGNKSPLKSIKCCSTPGSNCGTVLRTKNHEISLNPHLLFRSEVHRALNWNSFSTRSLCTCITSLARKQSEAR